MADFRLNVDPDTGPPDYPPCNKGVEMHFDIQPGANNVVATAIRVTATGSDAPDRIALHGGLQAGFTLFKESHAEPGHTPDKYSSQLQYNAIVPTISAVSVLVSCTKKGSTTIVSVDKPTT